MAELVGLKSGSELVVKEEEEVELRCIIHNARPRPDIIWYLGDQEFVRGKEISHQSIFLLCHFNNFSTFNLFTSEKQSCVCVAVWGRKNLSNSNGW